MIKKRPLPSKEDLDNILTLNKDTGSLYWKERPVELFPIEHIHRTWNNRFAGKIAGSNRRSGIAIRIFGVTYMAHRIAWIMYGNEPPPDHMHLDHVNGNSLDNRRENLRIASTNENARNCRMSSANRHGIKGIYWAKRDRVWRASIRLNYKTIHLGSFLTKGLAAVAYAKASIRYHGEFARPV